MTRWGHAQQNKSSSPSSAGPASAGHDVVVEDVMEAVMEPVMEPVVADPLDLSTYNSQGSGSIDPAESSIRRRSQDDPASRNPELPQGFFLNRRDCDTVDQEKPGRSNNLGTQPLAAAGPIGGTSTEEAHRCDMCGKTFAVPARLTRHYRTHTGELYTVPFYPDHTQLTNSSVFGILMMMHLGERPFVCEVCGKSFSVKENLSVHRRIHTKEKPYRCPHCGRGFEHSGKLHRHMRIHTGERPHQCSDCGKTFIQSGQLVIHMRSHTGQYIRESFFFQGYAAVVNSSNLLSI